MNFNFENIFPLLFFAFFAFILWSMFSKSGKGRMLGGKIAYTSKAEIAQSKGITKSVIRAHLIETQDGSKHVGIELSENAKLAASMKPIKLTKDEAQTLINMIKEVADMT